MAYEVSFTSRAERDLVLIFEAIEAAESDAALRWYLGIKEALISLERQPHRCPVTPESGKLRNLLYGHRPYVYRAIYRIHERQKLVEILHIRHGARGRFKKTDLS